MAGVINSCSLSPSISTSNSRSLSLPFYCLIHLYKRKCPAMVLGCSSTMCRPPVPPVTGSYSLSAVSARICLILVIRLSGWYMYKSNSHPVGVICQTQTLDSCVDAISIKLLFRILCVLKLVYCYMAVKLIN